MAIYRQPWALAMWFCKIARLLRTSSFSKSFIFYKMAKQWNLANNFSQAFGVARNGICALLSSAGPPSRRQDHRSPRRWLKSRTGCSSTGLEGNAVRDHQLFFFGLVKRRTWTIWRWIGGRGGRTDACTNTRKLEMPCVWQNHVCRQAACPFSSD